MLDHSLNFIIVIEVILCFSCLSCCIFTFIVDIFLRLCLAIIHWNIF